MVDRLRQEYGMGVEFTWKAFELRPDPVPLPQPGDPARRRRWETSILPMAAERGLVMRLPPVAPRTRLAFQTVEFARDHGKFDVMHRAIFAAFFEHGRDIGQMDVLGDLAAAADLDPVVLRQTLEARTYEPRVVGQEQEAYQLGITSVPTMLVGDDLATAEPVIGAVPYDWLKEVIDRAEAGQSAEWRKRALRQAIPLKQHDE